MEWITPLVIILGSFLFLIFTGMPVAFAFLFINLVGAYMLWGGPTGLYQIVLSFYDSLARFTILPIVMFVLMGDIMFRSGVASRMLV